MQRVAGCLSGRGVPDYRDHRQRKQDGRPTVITFNFGVNFGAQETGQSIFGEWTLSSRYNRQAMARLFGAEPNWQGGMVAQYLARPDVSDRNKNMVAALRSQIIELWENRGLRKTVEDPYRLPARLAMRAIS